MEVKFKFIAAVIAGFLFATPGMLMAQNPDLSQNPTPQGQAPVNQNQVQPQNQMQAPAQDQMQDQDSDQDSMQDQGQGQGQDQTHPAPKLYGPDETQQDQQPDQNGRPPMSEQPPKPSPNVQAPSMQRPGPYGYPPYPPYGNRPGYPNRSNQGNPNDTAENNGVARISMTHGDVSTQRGDSGDWSAAQVNAPVMSGDKISTGDKARAELQLDYANILRIAEHTQANITNLTRSKIQIQLGKGMANYTVLRDADAEAEIDTPNVAIRSERRASSFRILVTADDHTEVLVRKGEVEITTPQGGTRVGENQFITIQGAGDQAQYRIGEAPARDDWDQWNTDRDRMINGSASRRHTNDYYVGSQDLDNNGTWKNVPDYGQVWQPNVGPDWAPYRDGRWVFEPYWGWTWVSYEPWGWAPYHYGRWLELNGAWAWWPGPVYGYPYYRPLWAPAYVSFFGFGGGLGFGVGWGWGSIGWFPIGPCDFFHPWWGGWGGHFGYTGFYGYNRGGFGPLHSGNRFSNVRAAMSDAHFRGASSVAGSEFGRTGGHFQPVSHAAMQNAHFATGNLPVTPSRESLSASGRPAAASTLANRGGTQHFFSPSGTGTANQHSFAREQAQVSNAMRQSGVSPINGNRGTEGRSGENGARGNTEARGGVGSGSAPRAEGPAGREGGGAAGNGGWQKFGPMAPRATEPAGRSSMEAQNRGEMENRGATENRGAYGSSRGSSGYPGSEGRGAYGGSRPPLNMRQPIVTPRSYGGGAYGGRSFGGYPGYGGARSAPSYGGGRSAPSSRGGGFSRGGGSSHSGSSHGGGGSHGGGHGGHR